uniref:Uncharacterized protein n=1 Tax=Arundo donax TaxID=35708 RepID=A0A0A9H1U9_ARUDO
MLCRRRPQVVGNPPGDLSGDRKRQQRIGLGKHPVTAQSSADCCHGHPFELEGEGVWMWRQH